jgi:hypothetical protein
VTTCHAIIPHMAIAESEIIYAKGEPLEIKSEQLVTQARPDVTVLSFRFNNAFDPILNDYVLPMTLGNLSSAKYLWITNVTDDGFNFVFSQTAPGFRSPTNGNQGESNRHKLLDLTGEEKDIFISFGGYNRGGKPYNITLIPRFNKG